ncbi:MAG: ABC transporter permease [Opitutales bacterium]
MNKKPPAPAVASTLWADAWRRFRSHRVALACLILLAALVLLCVLGSLFSPYDYSNQNLALGPTSPSAAHWLGTDVLGRDLLTRLLVGGCVSLGVGLLATTVALTIGVTWGMTAGYTGGRLERAMMRVVDILYALPFTLFAILIMVLFAQPLQSWLQKIHAGDWAPNGQLCLLFLAIGAFEWLTMARVVRARSQELKSLAFVEAARSLGRGPGAILWHHLLPNLAGLIIVYATLTVPDAILMESFISFLGLGVQPPLTSWGDLINQGANSMEEYPWLLIFPSIFFALTLFALNFVGDGLRDALDPRSSRS